MKVTSNTCFFLLFFFFNDTATTEIYTLSLHDALPIPRPVRSAEPGWSAPSTGTTRPPDRKSTRLNFSHDQISYAVFCLKKKNKPNRNASVDNNINKNIYNRPHLTAN